MALERRVLIDLSAKPDAEADFVLDRNGHCVGLFADVRQYYRDMQCDVTELERLIADGTYRIVRKIPTDTEYAWWIDGILDFNPAGQAIASDTNRALDIMVARAR